MTQISHGRRAYRVAILGAGVLMCIGAYHFAHAQAMLARGANTSSPVSVYPPETPNGAAENMVLPALARDGQWITPNVGVTDGESLFHLRAGLNVAALGCRGMAYEQDLIDNYNTLQLHHKAAFAEAERTMIAGIARRTGTSGTAARDQMGTKVYNYFAMPPVQKSFCPTAYRISGQVRSMPSAELTAQAPALLRALDMPFQDFYTAYAQ